MKVEPPTISRWESGQNWPKPRQLERLAEILNVHVGYLFDASAGEPAERDHVVTRRDLLEMISTGKIPVSSVPAKKTTPEEALEILAEAIRAQGGKTLRDLVPAGVDPGDFERLLRVLRVRPEAMRAVIAVLAGYEALLAEDPPSDPPDDQAKSGT